MSKYFLFAIFILCITPVACAQSPDSVPQSPNPRTAFLKSLAVPGWGHHYVNSESWNRGKYHLGTDAVLLLSFFGFNIHSSNIRGSWYTYARNEAGIDIEGRGRTLQLAVGDFNSLQAYNDYQARVRNWDQFINDVPENRWNWQNDASREEYNSLRSRYENIDQQLPALIGLMVVNRLVSAISAYNRARKFSTSEQSATAWYFSHYRYGNGLVANFKVRF